MPIWLKAASGWGSVLVLIALVIAFLKQLIAFVGFITTAIQILIVLAFLIVIVGVGYLVFRAWQQKQKSSS